ncbi:hypothetical protein TK90_2785 (plasmid) [Thioalkalivibrio sp. K90mix]|nr:hypothetical protein TK90_2785 [Thioalkalivibrio sp. K90mix]
MERKPVLATSYELSAWNPILEKSEGDRAAPYLLELAGCLMDPLEQNRIVGRLHAHILCDWIINLEGMLEVEPSWGYLRKIMDADAGGGVCPDVAACLYVPQERVERGDLMVVERVEVLPEYEGWGFGGELIEDAFRTAARNVSLAVLRPFPLQFEGGERHSPAPSPWGPEWHQAMCLNQRECSKEDAMKRIIASYRRAGFVDLSDEPDPLMGKPA